MTITRRYETPDYKMEVSSGNVPLNNNHEYCSKCFPLDFRVGGMFYKTPDSVIREALAKHSPEDDIEEARRKV